MVGKNKKPGKKGPSKEKASNDEKAALIRKAVDCLLQLIAMPRESWKAVDLRTFRSRVGEIELTLESCKMRLPKERIQSASSSQDTDDEGAPE